MKTFQVIYGGGDPVTLSHWGFVRNPRTTEAGLKDIPQQGILKIELDERRQRFRLYNDHMELVTGIADLNTETGLIYSHTIYTDLLVFDQAENRNVMKGFAFYCKELLVI